MKQLIKSFVAFCVAIVMALSIVTVAGAEETNPEKETSTIIVSENGDDSKAYQLVWKYKEQGGHLYKRRWNNTLNEWYDPSWILVY